MRRAGKDGRTGTSDTVVASMLEPGTILVSRFEVLRLLGSGGMGGVYEALDRSQNFRVALKTLPGSEPEHIYGLKHEFRSLADVVHPNLVALYELISDGDTWFFTMELIDGVTITDYLWDVRSDPGMTGGRAPAPGAMNNGRVEPDRALDVFQQLALGIEAIHEAGKLHRDLKPSNVLVRRDGRVKVVDFGLAAPRISDETEVAWGARFAGTPAYMAPEQAKGQSATTATDWYAFGVMLYEIITRRLPRAGSVARLLMQKHQVPAPIPEGVQFLSELHGLCMQLLDPDPKRRPTGREVLTHLSRRHLPTARPLAPDAGLPVERADAFVGRTPELSALEAALTESTRGAPVVVEVHGPSGMGKTALLRRFAEQVGGRCRLLTARCHERESVPFKGVDGIVDALGGLLQLEPEKSLSRVLPRDVHALSHVFPTFGHVDVFADVPRRRLPDDPAQLRRRAIFAFAELLGSLSGEAPLVVVVDDFHWADVDSAIWFREVLTLPEAPACLFVFAHRADGHQNRAIGILRDGLAGANVSRGDIELTGLSVKEVRELARAERSQNDDARQLWQESRGIPFLVRELLLQGVRDARATFDLSRAIQARVTRIDEAPRRMLQLVAVAGRPVPASLLAQTPGSGEVYAAVASLKSGKLVRETEPGKIEPYHDRIRQAVIDHLSPETVAAHHSFLASVLEVAQAEPEILVDHFLGAGHRDKALRYALLASERAREVLAFERAAHFLELAEGLLPDSRSDEIGGLRRRRADALANAGRCVDAGELYEQAALMASKAEATHLRALSAAQKFLAGHVHEGIEGIIEALEALDVAVPREPGQQLALANEATVKASELRRALCERPAWRESGDLTAEERLRLDLLHAAQAGLHGFDHSPLGMMIGAQYILAALESREPNHVVFAMLARLAQAAFTRRRSRSAEDLLAKASAAARSGFGAAAKAIAEGLWSHHQSDVPNAIREFRRAVEILDADCSGRARERSMTVFYLMGNLWFSGNVGELSELTERERYAARDRGDFFAELSASLFSVTNEVLDRPDAARRSFDNALSRLNAVVGAGPSRRYVGATRMIAAWRRSTVELYAGAPRSALAVLEQHRRDWGKSLLMQLPEHVNHQEMLELRAHTALFVTEKDAWARSEAERLARGLIERGGIVDRGAAHLCLAGLAEVRGDIEEASKQLATALELLEPLGPVPAACVRLQLGRLRGGRSGHALQTEALGVLRSAGIANPERWAWAWTFPAPQGPS